MLWDTIRLDLLFNAVHLAHGLDIILDNSCFIRSYINARSYVNVTECVCVLFTLCTVNHVYFRQFSSILTIAFDGACSCIHSNYSSYKNTGNISEQSSGMKKKSEITTQTTAKNCGCWLVLFILLWVCVCMFAFFLLSFYFGFFFHFLLYVLCSRPIPKLHYLIFSTF